jgi:hypothetical protein
MIALLLTQLAWADDACASTPDGFVVGPVQASLNDGGLGLARRVCTRSEVAVGIDGRAVIQLADFYGYLPVALSVDASALVGRGFEVFAHVEAVRMDLALASFTSSSLGLGHTRLGAAWSGALRDDVSMGVHVSTVLPTATGLYRGNPTLGFDLGVGVDWRAVDMLHLHGHMVHHVAFGTGLGPRLPVGGNDLVLGLELRPVKQFGLVFDWDTSLATNGPLAWTGPAFGLRFGDGKRFGFELSGRVPIAGDAMELAALTLRGSARLGKRP